MVGQKKPGQGKRVSRNGIGVLGKTCYVYNLDGSVFVINGWEYDEKDVSVMVYRNRKYCLDGVPSKEHISLAYARIFRTVLSVTLQRGKNG